MDNNLFFYLVLICTLTHIIRAEYEILKHKKIIQPNKLSFIIVFTNMFLLWTTWFILCRVDKSTLHLPVIVNYLGIVLITAGVLLFLTALLTIKTLETYEGDLITKGIYSKIRHPMYLGFIFWLIGAPLFFGGLYSLILAVPFVVNVLFWRRLEEIELVNRFPKYEEYSKRTYF
ncbi:MAG: isoprenylcysteine carboxylmethyltransferase family protein [Ignavibacteriaceae bacterium]|nr:isoprenylcysteine carboxylmethyltransferase family protein [Ignavibacteriaceae bacterium]